MPLWFVLPESLCRFAAASISPLPPSIPLSCVSVGFDRRETRKGKHFQMIQLIEECWRERVKRIRNSYSRIGWDGAVWLPSLEWLLTRLGDNLTAESQQKCTICQFKIHQTYCRNIQAYPVPEEPGRAPDSDYDDDDDSERQTDAKAAQQAAGADATRTAQSSFKQQPKGVTRNNILGRIGASGRGLFIHLALGVDHADIWTPQ